MAMNEMLDISVIYSYVDGAHFFTSGDEVSHGLCVAHVDLEFAYAEVGRQLSYLLLANHAIVTKTEPTASIEEFKSWVQEINKTARENKIQPQPTGIIKWSKAA